MPAKPMQHTMTALLRKALAERGELSLRDITRATGVNHVSILKFERGQQSLRLDFADKLAEFFGIKVQPPAKRTRKG